MSGPHASPAQLVPGGEDATRQLTYRPHPAERPIGIDPGSELPVDDLSHHFRQKSVIQRASTFFANKPASAPAAKGSRHRPPTYRFYNQAGTEFPQPASWANDVYYDDTVPFYYSNGQKITGRLVRPGQL